MTILVAYFFFMLTGKTQLCLMGYRKNRGNSVFFGLLVILILKDQWGWFLSKTSVIRISTPLDLSSRSFIPLPRFMRSRRTATLLAPSLVFTPRWFALAALVGCCSYQLYRFFQTPHSFSVTIFTLGLRLFFNPAANKLDLTRFIDYSILIRPPVLFYHYSVVFVLDVLHHF